MKLKRMSWSALLAICFLLIYCHHSRAAEYCDVPMAPHILTIGATYNGGKVLVEGSLPSNANMIIEVKGATAETTLLKKEHIFNLLWMNNGEISIAGLPEVYMLYLPGEINKMEANALHVGFDALKEQADIVPDTTEKSRWLAEFFKLKNKEKLYAMYENAIEYQMKDGARRFSCELTIPAAMHQGSYTVVYTMVRDGKVCQAFSNPLEVKETGLPSLIRWLAFQHAWIYGILATVIAVLAGLLMGFIFQGEKGAH